MAGWADLGMRTRTLSANSGLIWRTNGRSAVDTPGEHNDSVGNNSVVSVQRRLSRSRRLCRAGVLVAIGRSGLEGEGDVYLAGGVSGKGSGGAGEFGTRGGFAWRALLRCLTVAAAMGLVVADDRHRQAAHLDPASSFGPRFSSSSRPRRGATRFL